MPAKLTATHQGITVTRKSDRPYTHVVMGLYTRAYMLAHYEQQAAAAEPGSDWAIRAAAMAEECRSTPPAWKAVSWHQGLANAQAGLQKARSLHAGGSYLELVLVEVDQPKVIDLMEALKTSLAKEGQS
jgi:hypothetical protein